MGLRAAVQDSGSGFRLVFVCQQSQSRLCYFAGGHLASHKRLSGSGKWPGDQNHKHITEQQQQQEGTPAAFQPISCFASTFLLSVASVCVGSCFSLCAALWLMFLDGLMAGGGRHYLSLPLFPPLFSPRPPDSACAGSGSN